MPVCVICGEEGEFWNDICDEHGRKKVFYLCPEHQKEYFALTERFLEGKE